MVASLLGEEVGVGGKMVLLDQVFAESSSYKPTLILHDRARRSPVGQLMDLSEDKEVPASRVKVITFGREQGMNLVNIVDKAKMKGFWVIVNNIEVNPEVIENLVNEISGVSKESSSHPDFRLFLVSGNAERVPRRLASHCLTVALNSPTKLGESMTYHFFDDQHAFPEKLFPEIMDSDFNWRLIYLKLCLIHSILITRRNYPLLDLHAPPALSDYDLYYTAFQIRRLLDDLSIPAFPQICLAISKSHLSPKFTDSNDRILFDYLFKRFFDDEAANGFEAILVRAGVDIEDEEMSVKEIYEKLFTTLQGDREFYYDVIGLKPGQECYALNARVERLIGSNKALLPNGERERWCFSAGEMRR